MAIYICFPAARKSVGGTRLKKILRNKGKGKKFQEARERGKVARSNVKTPYSTGRKGIPRVEHKMRKKRAQMVRWTDLYRVWLHMSTRITQDFGCDGKGYVCGMGGEVSKTEILAS
ncbi:uncharacterized protein LOC113284609 isoform X2 [Papaver somniferum]|uniref:uncharacterized protein LOC113284609 isoform X2 n=1 Tax=Papaver somniferum TaxID=3469 RepID=UPI000E6F6001|nr:uncharacterized protein LOC113284609 isoform X2 [Papaver somniferum]